ncbi:unnamed protein product, partial [Polarella glacialis]
VEGNLDFVRENETANLGEVSAMSAISEAASARPPLPRGEAERMSASHSSGLQEKLEAVAEHLEVVDDLSDRVIELERRLGLVAFSGGGASPGPASEVSFGGDAPFKELALQDLQHNFQAAMDEAENLPPELGTDDKEEDGDLDDEDAEDSDLAAFYVEEETAFARENAKLAKELARASKFNDKTFRGKMFRISQYSWFQRLFAVLIFLNVFMVVISADALARLVEDPEDSWSKLVAAFVNSLENFFIAAFVVEITIRLLGSPVKIWTDGWLMMDSLIVALAVLDVWILGLLFPDAQLSNVAIVRALRVTRIFRGARLLRLLQLVRQIKVLTSALAEAGFRAVCEQEQLASHMHFGSFGANLLLFNMAGVILRAIRWGPVIVCLPYQYNVGGALVVSYTQHSKSEFSTQDPLLNIGLALLPPSRRGSGDTVLSGVEDYPAFKKIITTPGAKAAHIRDELMQITHVEHMTYCHRSATGMPPERHRNATGAPPERYRSATGAPQERHRSPPASPKRRRWKKDMVQFDYDADVVEASAAKAAAPEEAEPAPADTEEPSFPLAQASCEGFLHGVATRADVKHGLPAALPVELDYSLRRLSESQERSSSRVIPGCFEVPSRRDGLHMWESKWVSYSTTNCMCLGAKLDSRFNFGDRLKRVEQRVPSTGIPQSFLPASSLAENNVWTDLGAATAKALFLGSDQGRLSFELQSKLSASEQQLEKLREGQSSHELRSEQLKVDAKRQSELLKALSDKVAGLEEKSTASPQKATNLAIVVGPELKEVKDDVKDLRAKVDSLSSELGKAPKGDDEVRAKLASFGKALEDVQKSSDVSDDKLSELLERLGRMDEAQAKSPSAASDGGGGGAMASRLESLEERLGAVADLPKKMEDGLSDISAQKQSLVELSGKQSSFSKELDSQIEKLRDSLEEDISASKADLRKEAEAINKRVTDVFAELENVGDKLKEGVGASGKEAPAASDAAIAELRSELRALDQKLEAAPRGTAGLEGDAAEDSKIRLQLQEQVQQLSVQFSEELASLAEHQRDMVETRATVEALAAAAKGPKPKDLEQSRGTEEAIASFKKQLTAAVERLAVAEKNSDETKK